MIKYLLAFLLFVASNKTCLAGDTTSVQVQFKFNEHALSNEGRQQLDEIPPIDSSITLTNIKIYGFTDQVGSNEYNNQLSAKRAKAVKDYLVKIGINPNIITIIKGKGESELVVDKMDEESRQQNRRVLVMIEYEAAVAMETVIKSKPKTKEENETQKDTSLIEKLKDTKAGNKFILANINFEGGRHKFLPKSYPVLEELLKAMQTIPTLEIEIQGHICCEIGDVDGMDMDLGTRDLSVQRARAVYLYLYRNGIDVSRMSYKGFGHQFPIIAHEESEEEKTTNRRVEIKIVKK